MSGDAPDQIKEIEGKPGKRYWTATFEMLWISETMFKN